MSWIQELDALTRYLSRNGSNTHVCHEVRKLVERSCKMEQEYEILMGSQSLSFLCKSHNDECKDLLFQDFGFKVLSDLVVRSVGFAKTSDVGIRFIMEVTSFLDKKDSLYQKCRRVFLKMSPKLSMREVGGECFDRFLSEILDDIHKGLCSVGEAHDTSSLVMYISYLEKHNEFRDYRYAYEQCCKLLEVLNEVLGGRFGKSDANMCFDIMILVTRLAKLCAAIEDLHMMVNNRTEEILNLAVLMMKTPDFPRVRLWLEDRNLLPEFFLVLLRELDCLFALVAEHKLTKVTLLNYGDTLCIAKNLSIKVDGGQKKLDDFLKDKEEEDGLLSKMLVIVKDTYCSNENLAILDKLMEMASPDLKHTLALTIIPNVKDEITFEININRTALLKDSMEYILTATAEQLRGKLFVKFIGEEGVGTGVTREWFSVVGEKIFDPEYNYFECDVADRRKIFPSLKEVKDLKFFTFFGRWLAITLIHHVQVGFTLDLIVIRLLAELDVSIEHVQEHDPLLYQNMMAEVVRHHNNNKEMADTKYSQTLVNEFIIELVAEKMEKIKDGIDYIIGPSRRNIFFRNIEVSRLDMELCGDLEDFSVDDWKNHTIYEEYHKDDIHVTSFWKVVRELTKEERKDLLFFWTSTKFLPPGGFSNLKFQTVIKKIAVASYPKANTCSNTLHIPPVPYEVMKYRLRMAISHPTGFGYQ